MDDWNFTNRWRDYTNAYLRGDDAEKICWLHLLPAVTKEISRVLTAKEPGFQGTLVEPCAKLYTSAYDPSERGIDKMSTEYDIPRPKLERLRAIDRTHENWAVGELPTFGGWMPSSVEELRAEHRPLSCLRCGRKTIFCTECSTSTQEQRLLVTRREKGVDMRLGTELVEYAIKQSKHIAELRDKALGTTKIEDRVPSIAVILSADGDYVPAAEMAVRWGLIVMNLTWKENHGTLPAACSGIAFVENIFSSIVLDASCVSAAA